MFSCRRAPGSMKPIAKKYSCLLSLTAIAGVIFCTPRTMVYSTDAFYRLAATHPSAICVPLTALRAEYLDETKSKPDGQFPDSFLLESANAFLLFETMKNFTAAAHGTGRPDSIEAIPFPRYSILEHDTASFAEVSKRIVELAARCSADVVVLPYSCYVKQRVMQAKGWRNGGGPGYDRPVSFSAVTSMHVQIWSRDGRLLHERVGRSDTGKPNPSTHPPKAPCVLIDALTLRRSPSRSPSGVEVVRRFFQRLRRSGA